MCVCLFPGGNGEDSEVITFKVASFKTSLREDFKNIEMGIF